MRFRVELRRVQIDGGSRIREGRLCDAIDAIEAAQYARAVVAAMYQEPECYWRVEAVVPLDDPGI